MSYEAAPGATPVVTGGRQVTGWRAGADGVWSTVIPQAKAGQWRFEQLWVNGRRATRARTPNQFYHYMARKTGRGIDPLTGQEADLSSRAITGRGDDLAAVFRLPREQLADVTAVVYHSWEMSRHRIAAADAAANLLVTTAGAPWPFFQWGPDQRYHLENFRAALDAPGEWFLDRDGTLSYHPAARRGPDQGAGDRAGGRPVRAHQRRARRSGGAHHAQGSAFRTCRLHPAA